MSFADLLTRPAARTAEPAATTPPTSDAGLDSGLPVVWHVIVDIPFANDPLRRTGATLEDAAAELRRRSARLARAQAVLATLRRLTDADDWQVSITRHGIRAERDGEPFEQLEQRLTEAGFDADDFLVHVEYARSWGML